jgi:hypothetical protein
VVVVESGPTGPPLQSGEIKDVIRNRQVIDLPLKGRQFLDLAMLSQGVVRPPGGTRGDAMQQAGNLINVLGNVADTIYIWSMARPSPTSTSTTW